MPRLFKKAVLTDGGARLIARSQLGEITQEFTRMVIGCGTYTEDEKTVDHLQQVTSLKDEKNSFPFSSIGYDKKNEHSIVLTSIITNFDQAAGKALIDEGYYITEIGIMCKAKGTDEEYLYSISVLEGDVGDFIPPYNGHDPIQIIQEYHVTVDNSLQVIINSSGAFALADDLIDTQKKIAEWEPILDSMVNEVRLQRLMHLENVFTAPLSVDDEDSDYLVDDDGAPILAEWQYGAGGSSGGSATPGGSSGNYEDLKNLPKINGTTLIGDKSFDDLGLFASAEDIQKEFAKEGE